MPGLSVDAALDATVARARAAFVRACDLDVAVRKPGNVSRVSPGHRMTADLFSASARAAAGPLFERGAGVGRRIEGATAASLAAAGCNTNLGIVLLCAPVAAAIERPGALAGAAALRGAIEAVLAALDVDDARGAYAAIAQAHPGGLGTTSEQDVHEVPSVDLRRAMVLAADRDSIAGQYASGYADLFDAVLPIPGHPAAGGGRPDAAIDVSAEAAVQRVFLGFLARLPDAHIVRKHGAAVAHSVMAAAQGWSGVERPALDPRYAAWDEELKAAGINPGTSADLTVAALFIDALAGPWHGS